MSAYHLPRITASKNWSNEVSRSKDARALDRQRVERKRFLLKIKSHSQLNVINR